MAFRHLEDLRGKHKGKEIWVLGRGPSLDKYPFNYFCNKISIALSFAYLAFPDCTYYHSLHAEPAEYVARTWPAKYSRCVLGCTQNPHPGDKQRRNRYEKGGVEPVYARVKGVRALDFKGGRSVVESVISKKSCVLLNSTTTLRTGIQVAIVLGAAKITLVGCELKISKGLLHAKRTWISVAGERKLFKRRAKWAQTRFFPGCEKDLKWLAGICKSHNIEIVRHFYGKGYEQIS